MTHILSMTAYNRNHLCGSCKALYDIIYICKYVTHFRKVKSKSQT